MRRGEEAGGADIKFTCVSMQANNSSMDYIGGRECCN